MRRTGLERALLAAGAVALAAFTLAPLYWCVVSSLETGTDLFRVDYWPRAPAFGNYRAVFVGQPFARSILNSVAVAGVSVAIALSAGVLAAYALGRIRFRGRRALLYAILAVTMFPQVCVLSGLFEAVRFLGLYNHLAGLVYAYVLFTLPFTVWVLTTFVRAVPVEIEEAARVDGAGTWQLVSRILLPLLRPGLAASGLLAFMAAWNEFLFALTLTLTDDARTVPVAIALMSGASQFELPWGRIMAASVVVTAPVAVLAMAWHRRIVAGLTAGAVKG